jgi:hypothetical protein
MIAKYKTDARSYKLVRKLSVHMVRVGRLFLQLLRNGVVSNFGCANQEHARLQYVSEEMWAGVELARMEALLQRIHGKIEAVASVIASGAPNNFSKKGTVMDRGNVDVEGAGSGPKAKGKGSGSGRGGARLVGTPAPTRLNLAMVPM